MSLAPDRIAELLQPYTTADEPRTSGIGQRLSLQLAAYLHLILKWNARMNLTAIRSPEEIVRRHFGESLFAGLHLPPTRTLLDFGSGAGFPGLPIALLRPDVTVTLAESRTRKAAFLREAVRTLRFPGQPPEVFSDRVESMPPTRTFDTVTLRAVDNMDEAVRAATQRATRHLLLLTTTAPPPVPPGFSLESAQPVPESAEGRLVLLARA